MSKKIEQQGTLELSVSDIEAIKVPKPSSGQEPPRQTPAPKRPKRPSRDGGGEPIDTDDTSLLQKEPERTTEPPQTARSTGESRRVIDDPFARTIIDGRYEVLRCLGTGAMGSVFLVKHLRLGKLFALKMVNPELAGQKEFIARFKREADACGRLEHPNCINVTDFGQTSDGSLYLVMEYADGDLLSDLVEAGPLPLETAFAYVRQILLGLKHAHGEGLIHRDIKMENIVICNKDNGDPLVKILDFGMARPEAADKEGHRITKDGVVLGTPQYMAPEQIRDQNVGARADLYAVGITLFRLITGKTVFDSNNVMEVFSLKLKQPAPTLKEVTGTTYPEALESFVATAIERDPDKRFANADQMLWALDALSAQLTGKTVTGRSVVPKLAPAQGRLAAVVSSFLSGVREETRGWYECEESGYPPNWEKRVVSLWTTRLGRILLIRGIALAMLLGVMISLALGTSDTKENRGVKNASSKTADTTSKEEAPAPAAPRTKKEEPPPESGEAAEMKEDEGKSAVAASDIKPAAARSADSVTDHPVLIDAAVLIEQRKCRLAEKKIRESDAATNARGTYLLGKIAVCRGKRMQALELYKEAIELDNRYRSDSGILEDVQKMLNQEKLRDAALTFLAEEMDDKAALPTLIHLAGHHMGRNVRHRAQTIVEEKGALSHVDMDVALDLDLNQTKNCKEKREIVEKLGNLDTKRARQALIRARDMEVKEGFFRTRPKHGCVRPLIISTLKNMKKEP